MCIFLTPSYVADAIPCDILSWAVKFNYYYYYYYYYHYYYYYYYYYYCYYYNLLLLLLLLLLLVVSFIVFIIIIVIIIVIIIIIIIIITYYYYVLLLSLSLSLSLSLLLLLLNFFYHRYYCYSYCYILTPWIAYLVSPPLKSTQSRPSTRPTPVDWSLLWTCCARTDSWDRWMSATGQAPAIVWNPTLSTSERVSRILNVMILDDSSWYGKKTQNMSCTFQDQWFKC